MEGRKEGWKGGPIRTCEILKLKVTYAQNKLNIALNPFFFSFQTFPPTPVLEFQRLCFTSPYFLHKNCFNIYQKYNKHIFSFFEFTLTYTILLLHYILN